VTTEIQRGVGESIRVVHQPGNGTRYEVLGFKLAFKDHEEQWLISFPLIGVSYYFSEGSYVSLAYVMSKLGRGRDGDAVCDTDLHEMCKLIALITGGTHGAATDENGNMKIKGHLVRISPTELTDAELEELEERS
jgi:hypothetical protein